jgi:RecA-family ATPase
MQCRQGAVLYINLELDRASCLWRFREVYEALGWRPETISAIDVWNLRGNAVPLDKLAPKLIRRAVGKRYSAVVIDPIYKLSWGDENDAGAVARFCNGLDRICHELGAAVIDAHHHSKGTQGQKRSIDRGSGSGVFGRDPDAILDLVELDIGKDRLAQLEAKIAEAALEAALEKIRLLQEHLKLVQRFAQSTALPDLFDATEESPR